MNNKFEKYDLPVDQLVEENENNASIPDLIAEEHNHNYETVDDNGSDDLDQVMVDDQHQENDDPNILKVKTQSLNIARKTTNELVIAATDDKNYNKVRSPNISGVPGSFHSSQQSGYHSMMNTAVCMYSSHAMNKAKSAMMASSHVKPNHTVLIRRKMIKTKCYQKLSCRIITICFLLPVWTGCTLLWCFLRGLQNKSRAIERMLSYFDAFYAIPAIDCNDTNYDPTSLEFGLCRLKFKEGILYPLESDTLKWKTDEEVPKFDEGIYTEFEVLETYMNLESKVSPLVSTINLVDKYYSKMHDAKWGLKVFKRRHLQDELICE